MVELPHLWLSYQRKGAIVFIIDVTFDREVRLRRDHDKRSIQGRGLSDQWQSVTLQVMVRKLRD